MKRHVLIYGLIGGILIAALKWTEYRFLVIEHSIEICGGLTAATFAVLGIWLGLKLTGTKQRVVVKEVLAPAGTGISFTTIVWRFPVSLRPSQMPRTAKVAAISPP